MPVRVVDASAIAAPLYGEAEAVRMAERLRGHRVIAPSILDHELPNIGVTECRREPDRAEKHQASYAGRGMLRIEEHAVDHDAVLALAFRERWTQYDAAYLWLSRILGVPLVSLDTALVRAAR